MDNTTYQRKELNLQEIAIYLPHGLSYAVNGVKQKYIATVDDITDLMYGKENWKPLLRPMSSMTESEIEEFEKLGGTFIDDKWFHFAISGSPKEVFTICNWLASERFDFQNLIIEGLALDIKSYEQQK